MPNDCFQNYSLTEWRMGILLTDGEEHVNVDLPVFERGSDKPAVMLIGQRGMVFRKALFHLRALDGVRKNLRCMEEYGRIVSMGEG